METNGNELLPSISSSFEEIVNIIDRSRERVFRAINRELIEMYWEIGRYVSEKVKTDKWGKSVVKEFADFVKSRYEGIKGFSPQNIWRMKQFYETYTKNEKLSSLLREISWTNNLIIMFRARSEEEREFYLILCSKNLYSSRELERQINSALFERAMISNEQNQLFIDKSPGLSALRDSYVLEFLNIPERHKEKELRKAIIANLRDFILEFGKDFTLVGEEYRVQVGNKDFKIDLLLYNRDVRKPNENPSVGLILCAGKDDEVVEYALSRSMSPTLIAEYQTHLPQKALLTSKLRELAESDGLLDDDVGGGNE